MKIDSFRAVVDLWGTREAMADEFGIDSRSVSKWWQRDSIPARWWPAVIASPVARSAGVSLEMLAALAEKELEART